MLHARLFESLDALAGTGSGDVHHVLCVLCNLTWHARSDIEGRYCETYLAGTIRALAHYQGDGVIGGLAANTLANLLRCKSLRGSPIAPEAVLCILDAYHHQPDSLTAQALCEAVGYFSEDPDTFESLPHTDVIVATLDCIHAHGDNSDVVMVAVTALRNMAQLGSEHQDTLRRHNTLGTLEGIEFGDEEVAAAIHALRNFLTE
ncbi:hypothetical protein KIPB_007992 [Kipferlia bialata]|uniref:Uncharacterized protein n=1 Tax=Kipferlia bialata TaxID=797122 RepID=A0A9K3GJI5_9EUKA|nr:hypothetical protein KIPB_007992 [Kipferlia bialata]|eukprot:g7992.t1